MNPFAPVTKTRAGSFGADAEEVVRRFEMLICQEAGDRSALDTLISGWLLEARSVFDLRRKQSEFRATSQLLGLIGFQLKQGNIK
jgi:hypothetical protein